MWAVLIPLNEKNLKVCEDIAKKDKSFYFGADQNTIIIYCANKNQAVRRGLWLKYKAGVTKFDVVRVEE